MLVLFIYAVQKEELKLKKRKCLLQYKFTKFVLIYYKISEEYKMKYSKFLLFIYIRLFLFYPLYREPICTYTVY